MCLVLFLAGTHEHAAIHVYSVHSYPLMYISKNPSLLGDAKSACPTRSRSLVFGRQAMISYFVLTNYSPPPPLDVVLIHHSPPAAPPRPHQHGDGFTISSRLPRAATQSRSSGCAASFDRPCEATTPVLAQPMTSQPCGWRDSRRIRGWREWKKCFPQIMGNMSAISRRCFRGRRCST
jgi:hypothetical protein